MLLGVPEAKKASRWPQLASIVIHIMAIGALVWRPSPQFIKASPSLRGNGGRGNVMALATPGVSSLRAPKATDQEEIKRLTTPQKQKKHKGKAPERAVQAATTDNQHLLPGMPGYILGSLSDGFALNHDVRAAISIVAPDPPIARSRLPEWIRGDVIVEVTIDDKGNVIGTRVLQTVGFGLEQVIVETLRQWRYIPAKVDGVSVASREDVHFHFPS